MGTAIALKSLVKKSARHNRKAAATIAVESQTTPLGEAMIEGLRDIARGDYFEIRREHIHEDVEALFRKLGKS